MTTTDLGQTNADADGTAPVTVFLDLDTVLLATHPGRYGPELAIQADLPEALARLSEVANRLVVLVDPPPSDAGHVMDTKHRIEVLRAGLGHAADGLTIATCPHGEDGTCDCAKPGSGLIQLTMHEHGLSGQGGWYVSADHEGVAAGRAAGLQTIRIGPVGEDHLSTVRRPDHEARDLMDAANRILLEELAAP